jgi:hypothetical protein
VVFNVSSVGASLMISPAAYLETVVLVFVVGLKHKKRELNGSLACYQSSVS